MNKSRRFYILLMLLMPFLASCSLDGEKRRAATENVPASYAEGAVNIQLTAEPGLNTWKEMPNSLAVIVVQGANKLQLENVLNNPSELRALFNGAAMPDSILKVDRYMLMPGQQHSLHIDRAENVRQVAVVAGYYPFPESQHIARFAIPVAVSKKHWWSGQVDAQLAPLQVALTLGNSSIVRITGADNLHSSQPQEVN